MVDGTQENPEVKFYLLFLALFECMRELFDDGEIIVTGTMNKQALDYRRKVGEKKVLKERQIDLVVLNEKMCGSFNLAEVKTLAFRLSVDHENLEGETKNEKIQSLIKNCTRNGGLKELLNVCSQLHPKTDWP